ncbi:LysR family transcriptional regulator [Cryptosporangium arvum]|uniref:LysR family transcriptional regulator n=1 Tax=Cryptosporangium arvum TaxID=80871 RepID=UPI0004B0D817|nr:LysR family transcriptional regulator [Cryptosporangium arvum]
MDLSSVPTGSLRVFAEVAARGTLTAAAAALGYTQSAVSRQIAVLERAAGAALLERRRDGVLLTGAGRIVLRHASAVLDRVAATERELAGLPPRAGTVRLGWYPSAGAVLVPRAIAALRRSDPAITVTTREGTTPVLVRALRAGTLDLAVLAALPPFRPFDAESPPFVVETLSERALCVAVGADHPLAARDAADPADLRGQRWIAGPGGDGLGVWPGLDERPVIAHTARDWLAKLQLVAAGCGVTTAPVALAGAAPAGVRFVPVRGGGEVRRTVLARRPGPPDDTVSALAAALRAAAAPS